MANSSQEKMIASPSETLKSAKRLGKAAQYNRLSKVEVANER